MPADVPCDSGDGNFSNWMISHLTDGQTLALCDDCIGGWASMILETVRGNVIDLPPQPEPAGAAATEPAEAGAAEAAPFPAPAEADTPTGADGAGEAQPHNAATGD